MRRFIASCAAAVLLIATPIPACSAVELEFHPIPSGPDLEDAIKYLAGKLSRDDYNTRARVPDQAIDRSLGRRLSDRIDVFVQDWVIVAKYDINGDGIEEWFFFFEDWTFCGTVGCSLVIAQRRDRYFETLCEIVARGPHVVVTDRVTINGYHELEAATPVRWQGSECLPDDDEDDKDSEEARERRAEMPSPDPLRPAESTASEALHDDDGYGTVGKGPIGRRSLGRYRLPPAMLIDTGWLDRNGNWTAKAGKHGVRNETDFLGNPEAQEDALSDYMRATERRADAFGLFSHIGRKVSGQKGEATVTAAGIMAAVQLMGAARTAEYFRELDGARAPGRIPFVDIDRIAVEIRLRDFQHTSYERLTRPSSPRLRRDAR